MRRFAPPMIKCVALGLVAALSMSLNAAAEDVPFPSLMRYELLHGDHVERLDVLRLRDHIEHRYPLRGVTEVWERDARGELSHWKIFERVGRSVHYTAGDLRTIHLQPDWEQLAAPVRPRETDRMQVRLLRTESCSAALTTCAPLEKADFREIEFADLGDSEHDPFVRTFLTTFGHAH